MAVRKRKRPQLLSATRPTFTKKPTLSSRKTRSIVRTHHGLRKQLQHSLIHDEQAVANQLQERIEAAGGLKAYQEASIQGQSADRGGDSSKVLMEWLSEVGLVSFERLNWKKRLRMLEVGALRVDNACARSGLFDIERIDLHSQHSSIKKQNFMKRPIPDVAHLEADGFDLVSLSLVVNFVGNPAERGEMLVRTENFLRQKIGDERCENLFPALFLVLPAPCVTNSRYMDEDKLEEILKALGYVKVRRKMSAKLVYYLWKHEGHPKGARPTFKKKQVRSGGSRNNFAITLQ